MCPYRSTNASMAGRLAAVPIQVPVFVRERNLSVECLTGSLTLLLNTSLIEHRKPVNSNVVYLEPSLESVQ